MTPTSGPQHPSPLRMHATTELKNALERARDQLQRMNDLLSLFRSCYNSLEVVIDEHFSELEKLQLLYDHVARGTLPTPPPSPPQ